MSRTVGLDFGTTNSAIAVATADGEAQLATFESHGQLSTTFRSILYLFHPKDDEARGRRVVAGPAAIHAYRDAEPRGRFIQPMKSFLASRLFDHTMLFNRTYRRSKISSPLSCAICALRRKHSLVTWALRSSWADRCASPVPEITPMRYWRSTACGRQYSKGVLPTSRSNSSRLPRRRIMRHGSIMMSWY